MHGAWPWPPARLATLPRGTPLALPTSSNDHEPIRAPRAIHQPINPTAIQNHDANRARRSARHWGRRWQSTVILGHKFDPNLSNLELVFCGDVLVCVVVRVLGEIQLFCQVERSWSSCHRHSRECICTMWLTRARMSSERRSSTNR